MRNRPGALWTLAGIVALLLFYVPIVNGVVAGAIGGWFEPEPKKAVTHGLLTALVLLVLQWAMQLYGAVWLPFTPFSAMTRAALCSVPLLVTATVVNVARTTHKTRAI